MAQQKLGQPVPGSQLIFFSRFAGTDEISQGLVRFVGDPHRGQIAGTMAARQFLRIATIEIRTAIEALQALRGVAKLTAVTIVSEVGALSRFPNPRQLMGYCGLVPSEFSSGKRIQRGCITKTGNAHLRRVLIEFGLHAITDFGRH